MLWCVTSGGCGIGTAQITAHFWLFQKFLRVKVVFDLLIGDLFNERLDEIIEPLETLRAEQEAAST